MDESYGWIGPPVSPSPRMQLHVGVLHFQPSLEPFPLLADPERYEPNTVDITIDQGKPFNPRCSRSWIQAARLSDPWG